MGWDLSVPWQYKEWKKENKRRAAELADLPWEIDPYTGRPTGRLLGEGYNTKTAPRSTEDVERWLRVGGRQNRTAAVPAAPTTPDVSIDQPWTWRNMWPAPTNTYGRWRQAGMNQRYQNWPDWYAPAAAVEDQPHLAVINQLLPYMAEDDVRALASQLYTAGGGAEGPFSSYLTAAKIGSPVYGGTNREPAADWVAWANTVTPTFPDKPWHQKWWANKPMTGRVTDWEKWWANRPPGDWQKWFGGVSGGASGPPASQRVPPGEPPPVPEGRNVPRPPARPDTYRATLQTIENILSDIPDATAKAWAQSVFNVYRDWTRSTGMRSGEEEAAFQAHLEELMGSIPESAQPYAAALQRLVQPTVRNPSREWYELPSPRRTSPTNWMQLGYVTNPAWL